MGPQPEGQPESHLMEEGRAEVNVSVREKIGNNTLGLGFSPPSTLFSKKHQALQEAGNSLVCQRQTSARLLKMSSESKYSSGGLSRTSGLLCKPPAGEKPDLEASLKSKPGTSALWWSVHAKTPASYLLDTTQSVSVRFSRSAVPTLCDPMDCSTLLGNP